MSPLAHPLAQTRLPDASALDYVKLIAETANLDPTNQLDGDADLFHSVYVLVFSLLAILDPRPVLIDLNGQPAPPFKDETRKNSDFDLLFISLVVVAVAVTVAVVVVVVVIIAVVVSVLFCLILFSSSILLSLYHSLVTFIHFLSPSLPTAVKQLGTFLDTAASWKNTAVQNVFRLGLATYLEFHESVHSGWVISFLLFFFCDFLSIFFSVLFLASDICFLLFFVFFFFFFFFHCRHPPRSASPRYLALARAGAKRDTFQYLTAVISSSHFKHDENSRDYGQVLHSLLFHFLCRMSDAVREIWG